MARRLPHRRRNDENETRQAKLGAGIGGLNGSFGVGRDHFTAASPSRKAPRPLWCDPRPLPRDIPCRAADLDFAPIGEALPYVILISGSAYTSLLPNFYLSREMLGIDSETTAC